MSEGGWRGLTRTPRRWVQFIGWFIGVEFFANVVLVSTASGVGWDEPVRTYRVPIQLAILGLALAFGLYQAFSRSIAGAIAQRVRLFGGIVERNEQLLAQVNRLEALVSGAQAEAAQAEAAARERERELARAQARGPMVTEQLAGALQLAIVADNAQREAAQLYRCHRTPRGELICTLPLGRRHGITQGMEFTLIDGRERRPLAAFRVTGVAESFAACTFLDGAGWVREAERYVADPLPEHTLAFPLPEAAREIDAENARRILALLASLETPALTQPEVSRR